MSARLPERDLPEGYLLLEALADRALREGDDEALRALVSLIAQDGPHQHFVLKSLRGYGEASTQTREDALQVALMTFMERTRRGDFKDLSGDVRRIVIRLARNVIRSKKGTRISPFHQPKSPLDDVKHTLVDPRAVSPQTAAAARDRETLKRALASLDTRVRQILELRMDGKEFAEIGRTLGISAKAAAKRVERSVTGIIRAIAERNPTHARTLAKRLGRKAASPPAPEPGVVRTFVSQRLPHEYREVVTALHYEGKSLEALSGTIGRRNAEARCHAAYVILERKFGVPFPETFREMGS